VRKRVSCHRLRVTAISPHRSADTRAVETGGHDANRPLAGKCRVSTRQLEGVLDPSTSELFSAVLPEHPGNTGGVLPDSVSHVCDKFVGAEPNRRWLPHVVAPHWIPAMFGDLPWVIWRTCLPHARRSGCTRRLVPGRAVTPVFTGVTAGGAPRCNSPQFCGVNDGRGRNRYLTPVSIQWWLRALTRWRTRTACRVASRQRR